MRPYVLGLGIKSLQGLCVLCRQNRIWDGYLCQACDEDFVWCPDGFTIDYANNQRLNIQPATYYTAVVKKAIGAFKDHENLQTLPILVHALYRLSEKLDLSSDTMILPIPTTAGRLIERGFYPVGILAEYLSELTGFEIYQGVSRPSESIRQRGLGRAERLNNLNGAFCLEFLPECQSLLLLDDVATTGSTFRAVAQLFADYPIQLTAVCVAHGSDPVPIKNA